MAEAKENKRKVRGKRQKEYRSCEVVSNAKSLAECFSCSEAEVIKVLLRKLNSIDFIKHYALILHNKDKNEVTGETKANHYHIVLDLKYGKSFASIAGSLGIPAQTVQKIEQKKMWGTKRMVADIGGALSYLTHRNSPKKYQYSDENVIASEGWDWKKVRSASEKYQRTSNIEEILMGIAEGAINDGNLTDKIEPHFYIKYNREIKSALEFRNKKLVKLHDRKMLVIYIQGKKGCGKTTLAKHFCEKNNLTYFISGGGNDVFQGYGQQEAVILDDVRPDTFPPEEWLKILDNNTNSLVRSRYSNKLITAKFMILTSTQQLTNFFLKYDDEDPNQLYRRVKMWIQMDKFFITYLEYKEELQHYVEIKKTENWIREKFNNPNLSKDEIDFLLNGFDSGNADDL